MRLTNFGFEGLELPPHLDELRQEVRGFLAAERANGGYERDPAGWDRYDAEFSRKVGARGWIGMTWPKVYGGRETSALERYVVSEELISAGAPVRAHWLADRQFGPLLLNVGTEAQKRTYLPRIAAGECFVCVGMSEPDSGSDLASIRTRADPVRRNSRGRTHARCGRIACAIRPSNGRAGSALRSAIAYAQGRKLVGIGNLAPGSVGARRGRTGRERRLRRQRKHGRDRSTGG